MALLTVVYWWRGKGRRRKPEPPATPQRPDAAQQENIPMTYTQLAKIVLQRIVHEAREAGALADYALITCDSYHDHTDAKVLDAAIDALLAD